ncbi:MAG: 1-acyl-sn-glycerol-3-phosphate acyltransferase [Candidatus Aminicenantes bacterium]|nr:1-acyl-sn-glycerol-3-phosphate acyltransferase [Candidatus Aminicenantes bacterium]
MFNPSLWERLTHSRIVRVFVYALVGAVTYPVLALVNRLRISGTEHLADLPRKNVLFVSNHQTYFTDVIAFFHVFCAVKWKRKNRLGFPVYLLSPFVDVFFIAAEETMKRSTISRLLSLAGALTIKRTWKVEEKRIQRVLDPADVAKIRDALGKSWVITFPQGTTKPLSPIRKGTAYLVKTNRPVVVPIVIRGFRRAFDRKGLRPRRLGCRLSVTFKKPLPLTYREPLPVILNMIMDGIEQSETHTGLPPLTGPAPEAAVTPAAAAASPKRG